MTKTFLKDGARSPGGPARWESGASVCFRSDDGVSPLHLRVVSAWARREERVFAHPTDWCHGIDPRAPSLRGRHSWQRQTFPRRLQDCEAGVGTEKDNGCAFFAEHPRHSALAT
jgi:hypothetical protein